MAHDLRSRHTLGEQSRPEGPARTPPQQEPGDREPDADEPEDASSRRAGLAQPQMVMQIEQPQLGSIPLRRPASDDFAGLVGIRSCVSGERQSECAEAFSREEQTGRPRRWVRHHALDGGDCRRIGDARLGSMRHRCAQPIVLEKQQRAAEPERSQQEPDEGSVQRWISASQNKSEAHLVVQSEAAPQAFEVANVDGVGLGVIGEVILVREVLNRGGHDAAERFDVCAHVDRRVAVELGGGRADRVLEVAIQQVIHLQARADEVRPGPIPTRIDAVRRDVRATEIGIHPAVVVRVEAAVCRGVAQSQRIGVGGAPGCAEFDAVDLRLLALDRVDAVGAALQALAQIRVGAEPCDLPFDRRAVVLDARLEVLGQNRLEVEEAFDALVREC